MRRRSSLFVFGAVSIASILVYFLLQFQSYKFVLDSGAANLLEQAESIDSYPNQNDGNVLRKFKRSHPQEKLGNCSSSFASYECLRVYEEQEKYEEKSQLFPVSKIKQSDDEQGFLEENIFILQNYIQEGNRRLDYNLKKTDGRAVLLLGNRGQAKSTLMKFLSQGQDSNSQQQYHRLIAKDGCWRSSHSPLNYFDSLWTNKFGSASSSTFGLPHFNLISNDESESITEKSLLLLYDYPDFHRQYPSVLSEILAHYFKQRVIQQAQQIKLFLTTPYSSIHRNLDKNWDFFNLLNEAAFVSRILEDGAAISMIVTMAPPPFELKTDPCFNKSRDDDNFLLFEISNFLFTTKNYLEDEYKKHPEKYSKTHIQAAVRILDSLISKDRVQYQRLGIFRLPNKNDTGLLQNLEYSRQWRSALFETLLENTEFTIKTKSEINSDSDNEENKTIFLSYSALSFVKKSRPVLQNQMMKSTGNLAAFIEQYYDSQILPCSDNFLIRARKIRKLLNKIVEKLKISKPFKDFTQNILQILNVPFPSTFSVPFLIQGDILNYFYDNTNNAGKFESDLILNITTTIRQALERVDSKLKQYEFNMVVEDSLSRIANVYSHHLDTSVPAIYEISSYNRARALNESMSKLLDTIESAKEMGQVARGIFKALKSLDISLAPENNPDLKFLKEISHDFSAKIVNRQCSDDRLQLKTRWQEPIQLTRKVGECTLIWHEFIKETFEGISNRQYKFIETNELFDQVTAENFPKFYQILKKLQIQVSSSPMILKYCESAIFARHSLFITSLNSMLNYTLKTPIECSHDESQEQLTVNGHFVSLTSVRSCQVLKKHPVKIQNIVILASQKIFLDLNVTREFFDSENSNTIHSLIMISPEILVPKEMGIVHLNLDGKDGTSFKDLSKTLLLDGAPGENGGNFLIFTNEIKNFQNLQISTNGGKGERGKSGKEGRPGINGIDANLTGIQHEEWNPRFYTYWSVIKSSKYFPEYSKHGSKFCKDPNSWYWPRTYSCQNWIFHGLNGTAGENGRDGGHGGKGGVKGHIKIFLGTEQNSLNLFHPNESNTGNFGWINANDGSDGEGGLGGKGGIGGKTGNSIIATSSYWDRTPYPNIKTGLHFNRTEFVKTRAPSGRDGKSGNSVKIRMNSATSSKTRNEPFHIPFFINQYLKFIIESNLDNHHTFYETPSTGFLEKLEKVKVNSTFLDLFEEFQVLESRFNSTLDLETNTNAKVRGQSFSMYNSLLTRIKNHEEFHNQRIKYLYLACLTKVLNYEDKSGQVENVLNISSYLNSALNKMETFRTSLYDSKILVLLENTTDDFSNRIQSKLTGFSRHISNILEPKIEQVQNQVDGKVDNLLNQIQMLRRTKTKVEENNKELKPLTNATTDLEQQEKFSGFFQDIKQLTSSLNAVASAGLTALYLKNPSKYIRTSNPLLKSQTFTEYTEHQLEKLMRFQAQLKTLASNLENMTSALEKHGVKSLAHAHQLLDKFMEQENFISMVISSGHNTQEVDAHEIIEKSRNLILLMISEKLSILSKTPVENSVGQSEMSELQNFVRLLQDTRNSLTIRFEMWEKYKNDQTKINELSLISQKQHRNSPLNQNQFLKSRMKSLINRINSDLSLVSIEGNKKFTIPTFLDISKWEIIPRLEEVGNYIQNSVKKIWNEFQMEDVVKECIGGVLENFEYLSQIFHRIEIFQNQALVVEFIKDIQSSIGLQKTRNQKIDSKDVDLERAITKNLVVGEYNQAISAFKNWVFPFFHFFVEDFNNRHIQISRSSGLLIQKLQLEMFLKNLEPGSAIMKKIETFVIPDIFENLPMKSSQPFYTWKHSEHATSIAKLFKGESILLTANIHQSPEGKDAIKFNSIGLNFPTAAENQSVNQDLKELLKYFKVSMSQIGNSYFRHGKKIYTASFTSSESTLFTFSYKRKTFSKEPAFFNQAYGNILRNKAVLSPYSTWNITISPVVNDETSKYLKETLAFFSKEEINVELIGSGTCVAIGGVTEDELHLTHYYDIAYSKITIKTLWNENPLL